MRKQVDHICSFIIIYPGNWQRVRRNFTHGPIAMLILLILNTLQND